MAKYRIKGARFLRMYTEKDESPAYAAALQAQAVVDSLCKVPWTRVSADKAVMAFHTSEKVDGEKDGFDANVGIRDRLDAALFCAGHEGGMHRAYANAAVYRFEMPASAIGLTLTGLKAKVTSDPYNVNGARLHILTNSTGVIPMSCNDVRGNDANGEALTDGTTVKECAKRVSQTVSGSTYWYPNSAYANFSPTTPIVLGKYLYLTVGLENYSTVRGNFLEGCSYIDNDVEITLSTECAALDSSELNDLSIGATPDYFLPVLRDGVTVDLTGSVSGVVSVMMTSAGISPVLDENRHVDDLTRIVDESDPDNINATIRNVYRRLFTGDVDLADFASCNPRRRPSGVGFCVRQARDVQFVNSAGDKASVRTVSLTASSLLVPFSVPESMVVARANFDWSKWLIGRTPSASCKFNFWFKNSSVTAMTDTTVKDPAIYNATKDEVDGWTLIGQAYASAGQASFSLPGFTGLVGTLLITAYVPQDSVSSTANDFNVGSAPFAYNGVTADSGLPVSSVFYPAFDPTHRYTTGESMRHVDAASAAFVVRTQSASVSNVCAGDGIAVGVSGGNLVFTSDGVTFLNSAMTLEDDIQEIKYLGGRFIAIGGWYIYTSEDGRSWTRISNEFMVGGSGVSLLSVDYSGICWVASTGSSIVWSYDFTTWSATTVSGEVGDVRFVGSFWLANVDGVAMRSTNGREWSSMTDVNVGFSSVAYSPRGVAFVSDELNKKLYTTSNAGMNWMSDTLTDDDYVDVVYDNGVWLALSGSALYRCASEQPGSFFKAADCSGGNWIAFNGSYFIISSDSCVACTANGNVLSTKTGISFGVDQSWKAVPFGGCWIGTSSILDDNASRSAYVAKNVSIGAFSSSNFDVVASPVRDRIVGYDGLCYPDVTIVG